MIAWPAVIKFIGDAELAYIACQQAWDCDPDLHAVFYQPEDVLVDSSGICFSLGKREYGIVIPERTGVTLGLDEVIHLVRLHAAQDGACCVSKLGADSIREAIALLA